jgi:hypothetical protein
MNFYVWIGDNTPDTGGATLVDADSIEEAAQKYVYDYDEAVVEYPASREVFVRTQFGKDKSTKKCEVMLIPIRQYRATVIA